MFTGIIEATGKIKSLQQIRSEWRLCVDVGGLDLADVSLGDSIAVNGCCLTVIEFDSKSFSADVSNETMGCTSLGLLKSGSRVNLEKAMLATSRFGGHIVSGHVDGIGELLSCETDGRSQRLSFRIPDELGKYIAAKGSICIDGTSLTVNEVEGDRFSINVIPHTQEETIIGDYQISQKVNLEVDLVARYLERLVLNKEEPADGKSAALDENFLAEHGFKD